MAADFLATLPKNINGSELLQEALTHSSFVNELKKDERAQTRSYERLEFLGDSILGLICSQVLWDHCPDLDEGQLSRLRSQLVSEESLAERARILGVAAHIRLGKGEDAAGGRARNSLLADVMEAVFAAIYLKLGKDELGTWLKTHVFTEFGYEDSKWKNWVAQQLEKDPKSRLQELFQSNSWGLPRYKCINEAEAGVAGPFEMGLFIDEIELARQTGTSKKAATASLARSLLDLGPQKIVELLQAKGIK